MSDARTSERRTPRGPALCADGARRQFESALRTLTGEAASTADGAVFVFVSPPDVGGVAGVSSGVAGVSAVGGVAGVAESVAACVGSVEADGEGDGVAVSVSLTSTASPPVIAPPGTAVPLTVRSSIAPAAAPAPPASPLMPNAPVTP